MSVRLYPDIIVEKTILMKIEENYSSHKSNLFDLCLNLSDFIELTKELKRKHVNVFVSEEGSLTPWDDLDFKKYLNEKKSYFIIENDVIKLNIETLFRDYDGEYINPYDLKTITEKISKQICNDDEQVGIEEVSKLRRHLRKKLLIHSNYWFGTLQSLRV